jgi:RND family efflux transporter MFP subunit
MGRIRVSAMLKATATAVTLAFVGLTGVARGQSGPPPAPVLIARASIGSVDSTLTATGTVVSRNDARLAAEVSGSLTWVAEPGTHVTKGAPLARIDTSTLKLQLREDEAQVRRLAANVELLETQLQRLNTLGAGIASRSQIDEAAARHSMARQEHEQARVARDRTKHAISRAVIRAPFPGHVVERIHQLGEYVGPGTEVLRLTDTENVEVVARAPVASAASLSIGQEVVVRGDVGEAASRIRAIVPVGDDRSRMLELRVALPDAAWAIGSAVRVELRGIALAGRTVVVPRDAVIVRANGAHVYRVGPDDLAERVVVRLGKGDASRVEVLDGLSAGDRIVVRGGERLTPGQPVRIALGNRSLASS